MNRYFFALELSSATQALLANWRDQELLLPYKAVPAQNLHITLAFLGALTDQQKHQLIAAVSQIKSSLAKQTNYTLKLNRLNYFKKPKVLYITNNEIPPWLTILATALSQQAIALGLFQEKRPYLPHITLYRKATALPNNLPQGDIDISVDSFSLFQSLTSKTGVSYQAIKRWYLTAKI